MKGKSYLTTRISKAEAILWLQLDYVSLPLDAAEALLKKIRARGTQYARGTFLGWQSSGIAGHYVLHTMSGSGGDL